MTSPDERICVPALPVYHRTAAGALLNPCGTTSNLQCPQLLMKDELLGHKSFRIADNKGTALIEWQRLAMALLVKEAMELEYIYCHFSCNILADL